MPADATETIHRVRIVPSSFGRPIPSTGSSTTLARRA
jgi:hypothetical protein